MRSKGILSSLLVLAGALMLVAALLLAGRNFYQEYEAGKSSSYLVEVLEDRMSSQTEGHEAAEETLTGMTPDYVINPEMEMPTAKIEGNEYIGLLQIPALGLELPVNSEWSYPKLELSPCRYSGSAYTGGFTIAGHNYSTHFGPLENLVPGNEIAFTDVKGRAFSYTVQAVETVEATAVEDMISEEWDLTLFTCTLSGQARVAVRGMSVE